MGYDGLYFNIFVNTQQEDEWVIYLKFSGSFEITMARMWTEAQDRESILLVSRYVSKAARPTHDSNTTAQTPTNPQEPLQ